METFARSVTKSLTKALSGPHPLLPVAPSFKFVRATVDTEAELPHVSVWYRWSYRPKRIDKADIDLTRFRLREHESDVDLCVSLICSVLEEDLCADSTPVEHSGFSMIWGVRYVIGHSDPDEGHRLQATQSGPI